MDTTKINIQSLLPQAPPFVFVDTLSAYEKLRCRTKFRIKPDTLFLEKDVWMAQGLAENMAQTCAAHLGYYNQYVMHNSVKIGFIGAIKNLKIYRLPLSGECLETEMQVKAEFGQIKVADLTTYIGSEVIAQGEMKIFEQA